MCGIVGMMYYDGREPDRPAVERMMSAMEHRGPDEEGIWGDRGITLGFRRLSIIDLAEGSQPLCNEDETVWIVFNGEIYNFMQLRRQLQERGHRFRTQSDTEVIVHLYEEYGEDCVHHLRGMFAFVIWDRRQKQLFGARDHFGIKPFYYMADQERFLFGSEIKSILAAGGLERTVQVESLLNYLTFQYVPEPMTMFKGIHKLPPAHYVKITADGQMNIQRYWDPMFEPEERPMAEYIEQIRETLRDSVQHHLVSDVERGCFLSSGIDSTTIAACMRDIEPIRTFSVGFEGTNNETIIAAQSAQTLGTEHYDRLITRQDFFDSLPKAVWHQDEPVADPSAIALYHVAQLAREHVTVVLSGEGADELFGGYGIYREPAALRPVSWLPGPMRRILQALVRHLPQGVPGRNYVLRGTTPLEERFLGNAKIFTEDMKAQLVKVSREMLDSYETPIDIAGRYYAKTKHLDPVSRMQYIDMNLWMPGDILMKADKMTMAHSLELRVPFLDREMFEVARKIPASYRIAGGTTKYILRKAVEGIVPEPILNRPKLGFPVPLRDWLKGKTADVIMEQIKASGIEQFVHMREVESLMERHKRGQGDYARRLWTVYIFAMWHSLYLEDVSFNSTFAVG